MSEYCKKRKCYIDENGQPINYLYQSSTPAINTLHDYNVEAKTMSVEESMIVGDRKKYQIEFVGTDTSAQVVKGNAAAAPYIQATGGADTDLVLRGSGSNGRVYADTIFRVADIGNENNCIEMRATGGNYCEITTAPSQTDPNVGLWLTSKGLSGIRCAMQTSFHANNTAAYSEIESVANVPTLSAYGTNANIDIAVRPKGTGKFISSWGYAELVNTSPATFTGLMYLNFGTASVNTFASGTVDFTTNNSRFVNSSGRTAQYIVSYTIGSSGAYTGSVETQIRCFTSGSSQKGRYAQLRHDTTGTATALNGTAVIQLLANEFFCLTSFSSASITLGHASLDTLGQQRVTVQQIA